MMAKLYLEIGTRVRDVGLIDLLRFPADACLADSLQWSASWWCGGISRRMRSNSREKILDAVRDDGLNEFQFKCKAEVPSEAVSGQVVGGWFWFNPSPFSLLWSRVPQVELKNGASELKRLTYLGVEHLLDLKFSLPYPSVLECCEIEFAVESDRLSDDELQSEAINLIRASLPKSLLVQEIFGYGCLRGECRRQMMLHSLSPWPAAVDELGPKFEGIYPILIGFRPSCEGFAEASGGISTFIPLSADSPSALVSTPPSLLSKLRSIEKLQNYLVTRDASTHYKTGSIRLKQ